MTTGAAPVDDLVWTSLEPFERRARWVAVTWAAIGRVLAEDRPIGVDGDEYLALHRWLRGCDADVFTRLVRTPQAYLWARHTEQALTACLNAPAGAVRIHAALAALLEEARLLVLAAALAAHQPLRFDRPLLVHPPVSLAVDDLLLVGDDPVSVVGTEAGEVLVEVGGGTEAAGVVREPTLPSRHGSIRLSPFVLQTSDIESRDRATVLAFGRDGHAKALPVMEASFDLVADHAPEAHRQIVASIDTIALHDPGRADRSQATLSDVPGTFAMPCSPNPYVNDECIIHEYFHNRLFALEEMDRVFEDEAEEAGGGPAVFSPWRVETRPLKGLLHSTYVFAPVAEFWLAVWRSGQAHPEQLALALDETIREGIQLRIGVELLRARARFTPWGDDILGALDRRVGAFLASCREAGVPEDTVAMSTGLDGTIEPLRWVGHDRVSVRQNIRANIERHDTNGDTRELSFAV